MTPDLAQFVPAWLAAARDPDTAAELEAVYTLVADATELRRPVCNASGRCCNFKAWDHRLYVTGLEAAYTWARLPSGDPRVTTPSIIAAASRGVCPLLEGTRCSVHTIKPLGCRIYFCDETAQEWQQDLCERALRLIRRIHERRGIPYAYAEWLSMLRALEYSAP